MYRLYLDEVGTDGLTHLDKDKHRYLSLTGVAMKIADVGAHLEPKLNQIKVNIFNHDPDAPLIFHRVEIVGGKGAFERIRTDDAFRNAFNVEILNTMKACPYTVITALIDKEWMVGQTHWRNKHPYHFLMEVMVEKYAQFLERQKAIGDIMPESRQSKDGFLQDEFTRVRDKGSGFLSADRIQSVIRAKKLKFRTKKDNISGLQLCDLLAHPSHMFVRSRMGHDVNLGAFAQQVRSILLTHKYDRSTGYSQTIKGYGYKHLP